MAIDLALAEEEVVAALSQSMGDTYAEGDPTDYVEFAETMAPAFMAILMHITENATAGGDPVE